MKEFFKKHVQKIRNENIKCEECGRELDGIVAEVAHILPKARFKSLAENDENILYLCSWTKNNCHGDFDRSSNEAFKKMKVFPKAQEIANRLLEEADERVTIKDTERYE